MLTVQRQVWNEFTRYLIFCEYGSVIFEKWNDLLEFGGNNYLYGLWVNENVRGKGIGEQLLQKAEEMASAENCTEIFLEWSKPTPQWVFEWYMRNGYEEYELGGDSALLRKQLV